MSTPCLYSIIRYAPYAETEEFANIGVIVCAPKLGKMSFKLTKSNDTRVKSFFKDDTIFHVVKPSIEKELQTACNLVSRINNPHKIADFFNTLTSPRESIFYYSTPRILLTSNYDTELMRLYRKFIKHTEHTKERREEILARELKERFQSYQDLKNLFRKEVIGGELTRFSMPLVARNDEHVLCAIKPLAFTQDEPSKMLEHCDTWVSRVKRAISEDIFNLESVLFTIDSHKKPSIAEQKAIDEIRKTLDSNKIPHFKYNDDSSIVQFAKSSI
ncbi:DUF3037 domain-containing protein [Xenorhabdus bovienii]|uniref:DUF3037 domain-containing protein n=1 Tax=Xenorhabdus aichiensis TaxID=3025874 RepID=A0ABT5M1Y3_9GAMM|nr:DUF3037 domain-containing protein [Xenorhabdus aichiensis]MDC9620291.1 DUF3037 domain-containing protein [Xenorhabdus aichiensis]